MHKRGKMLELFKKLPKIIPEAYALGNVQVKPFDNILVCGMGGSGFPGYLLRDLVEIPVVIAQSYTIPHYVTKKTLAFIISYSGNTEETIAMLKETRKRTKNIVLITSNGKLSREKERKIIVPTGMEPRDALPYLFFPMWKILKGKNVQETIQTIQQISVLETQRLARKLKNKFPIIYASAENGAIALRWKTQLNEDDKKLAIANVYPEMNHNEIESDFRRTYAILIRDKHDHYRIKKRMNFTKKHLHAKEIYLKGSSKLARIFYGIYFGDLTAYYLASLYNKDPYAYVFIESLKKRLRHA